MHLPCHAPFPGVGGGGVQPDRHPAADARSPPGHRDGEAPGAGLQRVVPATGECGPPWVCVSAGMRVLGLQRGAQGLGRGQGCVPPVCLLCRARAVTRAAGGALECCAVLCCSCCRHCELDLPCVCFRGVAFYWLRILLLPAQVCALLWVLCEISIVALDLTMLLGETSCMHVLYGLSASSPIARSRRPSPASPTPNACAPPSWHPSHLLRHTTPSTPSSPPPPALPTPYPSPALSVLLPPSLCPLSHPQAPPSASTCCWAGRCCPALS